MHNIELLKGGGVVATYPISWTDDVDELEKIADQLRLEQAASGWRIVNDRGQLVRSSS